MAAVGRGAFGSGGGPAEGGEGSSFDCSGSRPSSDRESASGHAGDGDDAREAGLTPRVEVAGASRAMPGQSENGDAWVAWECVAGTRVAVIDGLGHGPAAAAAAEQLRGLLVEQPECTLEAVVARAAGRMVGGRGAVAMLIEVRAGELLFVGVGNVEGRLQQRGQEQRLMGARGFFGAPALQVRSRAVALAAEWSLYLYTDGVSSRFPLPAEDREADAQEVVEGILEGYARPTDDATVVMVREARPPLAG